MFDPLRSQLLSCHSLYISPNEVSSRNLDLNRLLRAAVPGHDTFLQFIVPCGQHHASVQIQITSFESSQYPEQTFQSLAGRYWFCCPFEKNAYHEKDIWNTAHSVYNSLFPILPWNFLSHRYWTEDQPLDVSSSTSFGKSCFELAVEQTEEYIFESGFNSTEPTSLPHTRSDDVSASNAGRVGGNGDQVSREVENNKDDPQGKNEGLYRSVDDFLSDIQKNLTESNSVYGRIGLTQGKDQDSASLALANSKLLATQSNQQKKDSRLAQHLSICFFLVWMELEQYSGTNERTAAQTKMKEAGYDGSHTRLRSLRDEAKFLNRIVATLQSTWSLDGNKVFEKIFSTVYGPVRTFSRMGLEKRNAILSRIVTGHPSWKRGIEENQEVVNTLGVVSVNPVVILRNALPNVTNETICKAIDFQRYYPSADSQCLAGSASEAPAQSSRGISAPGTTQHLPLPSSLLGCAGASGKNAELNSDLWVRLSKRRKTGVDMGSISQHLYHQGTATATSMRPITQEMGEEFRCPETTDNTQAVDQQPATHSVDAENAAQALAQLQRQMVSVNPSLSDPGNVNLEHIPGESQLNQSTCARAEQENTSVTASRHTAPVEAYAPVTLSTVPAEGLDGIAATQLPNMSQQYSPWSSSEAAASPSAQPSFQPPEAQALEVYDRRLLPSNHSSLSTSNASPIPRGHDLGPDPAFENVLSENFSFLGPDPAFAQLLSESFSSLEPDPAFEQLISEDFSFSDRNGPNPPFQHTSLDRTGLDPNFIGMAFGQDVQTSGLNL